MATRSTITIKSDHKTAHLYRHWDGYPEATGRHLAHVVRREAGKTMEDLMVALFTAKEGTPHGSGKYEHTNRAEGHGDREWHYEITLRYNETPLVKVFWFQIGSDKPVPMFKGELVDYRNWVTARYRKMAAKFKARVA